MKKRHLKSLELNKNTISNLTATRVLGGVGFAEEGSGVEGCQGMATRTACSTGC
ncbi:hypothetical protein ACFO3O_20885 [Dokdonia ponticola]|uniref:Class I lanthipeptide n=1 Tax=Dokdonia ponticola TaxID=2041041 RepID=A0ABV9I2M8_9FLAO